MRRFSAMTAAMVFALTSVVVVQAEGESLTVSSYCALSVDRLQLVVDTLEQHDRVPTNEELTDLYGQFGTTAVEYTTYRGAHAGEVDAYLEEHPEIQEDIDRLSARIDEIIQSKEESQ